MAETSPSYPNGDAATDRIIEARWREKVEDRITDGEKTLARHDERLDDLDDDVKGKVSKESFKVVQSLVLGLAGSILAGVVAFGCKRMGLEIGQ